MRNSHGGRRGRSLRGSSLVDLVLGSLDLGLQMRRGVEVLALFPRASPFDVIHAHGDRVVVGVDHRAVCRMREPTVVLPSVAVAALVLSADLKSVCPH